MNLSRIAGRIASLRRATDPGMELYLEQLYIQVQRFFLEYLASLGTDSYASAGGFGQFLTDVWDGWDESDGIPPFPVPENIEITYLDETLEETDEEGVMFAQLNFYKLAGMVSDKFVVEEHGSDKFDVSPVGSDPAAV